MKTHELASKYPLPAELYDSKDWRCGTYAERVEWLHTMYEDAKGQIAALEQSQGEQAPVAWLWVNKQTGAKGVCFEIPTAFHPDYLWRHLYTHPQPAQKPLTDDQVLKAVRHLYQSDLPVGMGFSDDLDVARAIEAAHNIK